MNEAQHQVGDSFKVQFVWQIPEGDFLRAIFTATVLTFDLMSDKYVVQLTELTAGRQESASGEPRTQAELAKSYWGLVGWLVGQKAQLAVESEDGRPLHMRLATLTGEHNFFHRFDE